MSSRFLTLGPGTNHAVVAARYLEFLGVDPAQLEFVETPDAALAMLLGGEADWFILCSVHPAAPRAVGHFMRGVFIADCFIAPSKKLAILTHADVARPRSIGLFSAVEDYADVSAWETRVVIGEGSLVAVGARLLAREFDSALVYAAFADEHPGMFRVDAQIESPDDAWLVLGRQRVVEPDGLVARRDSAVAATLHKQSG
jgi:hypothetical protein